MMEKFNTQVFANENGAELFIERDAMNVRFLRLFDPSNRTILSFKFTESEFGEFVEYLRDDLATI